MADGQQSHPFHCFQKISGFLPAHVPLCRQCRFRVLELSCLQVLRPAEALAFSGGDSHPCQQATKQGEITYLPAVVICRCSAQPSDGFRCEVYVDGTEILRFPESMLFLVPCCCSHHFISVCERNAGLWMTLVICILQREFSLSFRCRSGTPPVFAIMLIPLWFSFSRHLRVCPAASASAHPPRLLCPTLYASVRRSHGTTGRC